MAGETGRPTAYSGGQKLLHWAIALLVLAMIPVGLYMVRRGAATNFDAATNALYTAHKTFGMLILLLMALRLALRLGRGAPAPEPTLTPVQRIGSESVHGLLYVMLFVVPLLGWAGISAYPALGILGGYQLPALLAPNQPLAETLLKYHGYAALAVAGLVALHIGAALFHRLILKDGVLRRMLP
ncbi:cytochrome b [Rhabdaerophilum calidifontis]|uniref:cytochrome b n=1 Tax=Rhabdaerophilum calidifontis TaxID=2604328 RepID=UPI00123C1B48|nr:cytochrome b [Rhabdaerophilum calidifontis]